MAKIKSEENIKKAYKKHVQSANQSNIKDIWTYKEFKDWSINGANSKVNW